MAERPPLQHPPWSQRSLVTVGILLAVLLLITVVATAPFMKLFGAGSYAIAGAFHALCSFIHLVTATIALYLAWRLFNDRLTSYADIQLVTTVLATLSLLTIVLGHWISMAYLADSPDSPSRYFLKNLPEVHTLFYRFKVFCGVLTLPTSMAAAFIFAWYGPLLQDKRWLRLSAAMMVALHFLYFVIAFGLGAAITKLKPL